MKPEDTLLDSLCVAPAGLTLTQCASVLARAGHRIAGRAPTTTTTRPILESMAEVQYDGRYGIDDPVPRARQAWREGRLIDVLRALDVVDPYGGRGTPGTTPPGARCVSPCSQGTMRAWSPCAGTSTADSRTTFAPGSSIRSIPPSSMR